MKTYPIKLLRITSFIFTTLISLQCLGQSKKIRQAIQNIESDYTLLNDKVVLERNFTFNNLNEEQIYQRALAFFTENKETTALAQTNKEDKIVRGYIKFFNVHQAVGLYATAYHASCKISFNISGNSLKVRILSMDYILEGIEGGIASGLGEIAGELAGNSEVISKLNLDYNQVNSLIELNQETAKQERDRLGVQGDFKVTSVYPFGYYKRAYAKAFIGLISQVKSKLLDIKSFILTYTPPKEDKDW